MSITEEAKTWPKRITRGALLSGIGILLLLGIVAWLVQLTLVVSIFFLTKTLLVFGCCFAVLFINLSAHLPHHKFGAANKVTLIRVALAALLFGFVREPILTSTAWLIVAVAVTSIVLDGVDGWLARHQGLVSRLGARFDMETDALLILILSVLAWQLEKCGIWILLAGTLRYLFIGASLVFGWLKEVLPPSRRRQTICVLQILSLIICLMPIVTAPWSALVAATGLVALIGSFLVDVSWLAHRSTYRQRRNS